MDLSSCRIRFFAVALAFFAGVGCSSTEEQAGEEGLQTTEENGEDVNNDASDEFAENVNEDYAVAADEEGATDKVPIPDNGYDDDWNNMGTGQQQQLKQNTNKNLAKNTQANQANQYGLNQYEQTEAQQTAPQYQQQAEVQYEPPLDQAVPQYQAAPVANYAAAEPIPEALPPAPVAVPEAPILPEAGTPLIKGEVLPQLSEVWWVGYDFTEDDRFVRIEIVTRGAPKFNVFQERNQNDQPELVLRFFDSNLRPKLRRDIDASEFRSPVAYVRMRPDLEQQHVDVILTMRDAVQPRLYAENGNVLMTFAVPDYYLGNAMIGDSPVAQAEILPNATVMPQIDPGSELPEGLKVAQAYVPNIAEQAFTEVPVDGGAAVEPTALPVTDPALDTESALPASFDNYSANTYSAADSSANANLNSYGGSNAYGTNAANENAYGEEDYDSGNAYGTQSSNVTIETGAGEGYEGEYNYQSQGGDYQGQYEEEYQQGNAEEGYEEESGDYEYDEQLDNDSLDDYEYEDNGSGEDIDKFEVRVKAFRFMSVAQDNYAADDYEANASGNYGTNAGDNYEASAGGNYGEASQATPAAGNNYGGDTYNAAASNEYGEAVAEEGAPVDATLNAGGTGNFDATVGGDEYGSDGMFDDGAGDDYSTEGYSSEGGNNAAPVNAVPANTAPVNAGAAAYSTATPTATDYSAAAPVNYGESAYSTASPTEYGNEVIGTAEAVPPAEPDNSRRIELDFDNAPLAAVIKTLSEESGVNFILSSEATNRKVSIKMSGISFNDALKAILDANDLGLIEIGPNLIRIDSLASIALAEENKLKAQKAESLRRPTQILVHRLSYAKAQDILTTVTGLVKGISPGDTRVSVQIDNRTNSIIVNAAPSVHGTVKALLERVDLETPQVKIASRIIEVNSVNDSVFGVSWNGPVNYDQAHGLGFGSLPFPNNMVADYAIDAGGAAKAAGNFNFVFGSIGDVTSLDLHLSMNEVMRNIEILQTSDVIVEDNTEATITAGGTDFFQPPPNTAPAGGDAAAGAGTESGFNEIPYDLTLIVTPRVTADGRVQMALNISSTTPTPPASANAQAGNDKRSIKTSLLRRSGETAVIGGVYNTRRNKTVTGIPGLSSLPLIGALFRSTTEGDSKKELMILVTPTILGSGGGGSPLPAATAPAEGNYNSNYSSNAYGGEYDNSTINGGNNYGGDNYNAEGQQYSSNQYQQQGGNEYGASQQGANEYSGNQQSGNYSNQQGANNYSGEQQGTQAASNDYDSGGNQYNTGGDQSEAGANQYDAGGGQYNAGGQEGAGNYQGEY